MKLAPPSEAFPASLITIIISGFFLRISSIRQQLSPSFSLETALVSPRGSSDVDSRGGSALKSELVARNWYAGASSDEDVGGRLELSYEGCGLCAWSVGEKGYPEPPNGAYEFAREDPGDEGDAKGLLSSKVAMMRKSRCS